MTIRQAAIQRAKFIKVKRELLQKNITSIERKLFNSILDKLIKELDVADGRIVSNDKNINLTSALDQIVREFNTNEYAKVIRLFADDLLELQGLNRRYFQIIETDKARLGKISQDVNTILNHRLGITNDGKVIKDGYLDRLATDPRLKSKLKQLTYKFVTQGKSIDEFREKMKTLVQGNGKVNGELTKHMNRFAYDTYQQYDRTNGELWAKKLDLKAFLYNGGKIATSRGFCKIHNGKVYTVEEAQTWRNDLNEADGPIWDEDVDGRYNPFRDAGGYNCRHTLDWISNAMAVRLRPELAAQLAPAA